MECTWLIAEVLVAHVVLVTLLVYFIKGKFNVKRKFPEVRADGAVVITGGSSGIGYALAVHLADKGHTVYAGFRSLSDSRIADLQGAAADPTKIIPVVIDVTKQDTIDAAAAKIASEVEGDGIAALVNSAGFNLGPYPLEFVDVAGFERQLDVNVTGQLRVVQAFLPLIRQGQGRIVFMSSVAGKIAGNFQGPYAASKFALEAIADSLRRELYPWNLSVSVINAGEIETPLLKSFEKEAAAAKANLAKRSEQAVDYYGAYYDNFKPTRAKFVGKVRDTNKAIEHAIRSKYPKTRYTVAAKAMLKSHLYPSFFLGFPSWSILPDRFFDKRMARSQWPKRHKVVDTNKKTN